MNIPQPSKPLRGSILMMSEILSIFEQIEEPLYQQEIDPHLEAIMPKSSSPGKTIIVSTPSPHRVLRDLFRD